MAVSIQRGDDTLVVKLSGELDHHAAVSIRHQTDEAIKSSSPAVVIFDFTSVTFMDSSGIGLIMGRYRLLQGDGGKIIVRGASPSIVKVMKMAGLERLAKFQGGEIK